MCSLKILTAIAVSTCLSVPSALAVVTKTAFRAELDASVVQPQTDPDHGLSTAIAIANFILTQDSDDPAGTTLSYDVIFDGLDVAPTDGTNLDDDITAIHIHDTTVCVNSTLCGDGNGGQIPGSTAGTKHVLNVLGMPRNDDADVMVFPAAERVTGLWDANDANMLMPAPSASIADPAILDLLFDGKLALMVHTSLVASGEIGGFLLQVPEPNTAGLALATMVALSGYRRRIG
ncbi:MAG: CHRD domain-containing protein [Planctomycetota bacterium]